MLPVQQVSLRTIKTQWKYTGIGIAKATTGIQVNVTGGIETRVKNVAALACIKF
jgi:hypothetical protein